VALVRTIKKASKDRQSVHGPTDCSYSIFTHGGETYLQLDTYGSATRKHPEKISQSIQLNRVSAKQLKKLIERAFPDLR
jgi:hypothetical protein